MGKRYYYTDHLAAAWMAENHGMKFWNGGFCLQPESVKSLLRLLLNHEAFVKNERAYIHPDSLHLLKPQIGDMVQGASSGIILDHPTQLRGAAKEKIIQRDGKPFHWPERKE